MNPANQPVNSAKSMRTHRILLETLIVFALTVIPSFFWPSFKIVSVFLPIAYLLIERQLRKRPWSELGFDSRGIKPALASNWFLILLIVGIQFIIALLAKTLWPEFLVHVKSRIPLVDITQLVPFLIMMIFTTLGEEMAFRSLFQERLSWFIKTPIAIFIVSIVFGALHWAQGDPMVAFVDVALVTLDGAIFGIIFSRGKNLYAAWVAHFISNTAAAVFLSIL
jgi:membrane protease YdiL (CAAX protease family)